MQIILSSEVYHTISSLVACEAREFTLFGKSEPDGQGNIRVIDIIVPEQESGGAETEVSETNLLATMTALKERREDIEKWNVWIHSHNTMGAFWSGTDTRQMESFNHGKNGAQFFYHVVVSTEGWKGAYSIYHPFTHTVDDIPIKYETASTPEQTRIQAQIDNLKKQLETSSTPRLEQFTKELEEKNKKTTRQNGWNKSMGFQYDSADPYGEDYLDHKDKQKGQSKEINKQITSLTKKTISHKTDCECRKCERLNVLWESQLADYS